MEHYMVKGGTPLSGEVEIAGAKNAALPIIAASIMTNETVLIENVPDSHALIPTFRFLLRVHSLLSRNQKHASLSYTLSYPEFHRSRCSDIFR